MPDKLIDPREKPFSVATLGMVYRLLDQDLVNSLAEQDFAEAERLVPSLYTAQLGLARIAQSRGMPSSGYKRIASLKDTFPSMQMLQAYADVLARLGADVRFGADWIEARRGAGRLAGGTIDCTAIPDAAMTLAITALAAREPTTLTGIASWRVKETDRIAAMSTELRKLGVATEPGDDRLTVYPADRLVPARIDTYDDHRMAMCFSLVSLLGTEVTIRDPQCVRKTFPRYFDAFQAITAGAAEGVR